MSTKIKLTLISKVFMFLVLIGFSTGSFEIPYELSAFETIMASASTRFLHSCLLS